MTDPSDTGLNNNSGLAIGVIENDDRTEVRTFEEKPIKATVAIDGANWGADGGDVGPGTGILVGPNHVLTAGHVMHEDALGVTRPTARVTLAEDVGALPSRFDRIVAESNTVGDPLFPADYDVTRAPQDDIALVQLSAPLLSDQDVMGMVVFMDHRDALVRDAETAGYPFDLPTEPTPGVPIPNDLKTLYRAGDVISYTDRERVFVSEGMDASSGQSGSGIWTEVDEGADPLVLGVVTQALPTPVQNSGRMITKDVYDKIVARMEADDGDANADRLPENTIFGTDSVFGLGGGDEIFGSYRREQLLGQSGDDRITGGGADDRIDGGKGTDEAIYLNPFDEYLAIPSVDPASPYEFVIGHVGGDTKDAIDRLRDVEFARFDDDFVVPLKVDPQDPTKLADGPTVWSDGVILDAADRPIGTASLAAPTWSVDGDVRYTLTLGSDDAVSYNFALVIDVSNSMEGEKLQAAKAAYRSLIDSLIASGVAANATFSVITFADDATTQGPLTADQALAAIAELDDVFDYTDFVPPVTAATDYLLDAPPGATNVTYFLSDGDARESADAIESASAPLRLAGEVRAFGIGESVNMAKLDAVDSGAAVRLENPEDLEAAFRSAAIDRDTIERVDVLLDGTVVDTLLPDQFVSDTLGLTYEGEIDGLAVGKTAENDLEFAVVFKNGAPDATVQTTITSGQETRAIDNADGTVTVTLAAGETDYESAVASATITGNDRANSIRVGEGQNVVFGVGGDDVFQVAGGVAVIDGGAGSDTARFDFTRAEAGDLVRTADVVSFGGQEAANRATLVDVEYAAFTDRLVDLSTLEDVQPLRHSVGKTAVEGDWGETSGVYIRVELDQPATTDIRIQYQTSQLSATADEDFESTFGEFFILAGGTSGGTRIAVTGDDAVEGDETFEVQLFAPRGTVFENNTKQASTVVEIDDDDSAVSIPVTGADPRIAEGGPGVRTLEFEVARTGDVREAAIIDFAFEPVGSTPAREADFNGAFPSGEIAFEPGQDSAVIAVDFVGNDEAGDNGRAFGISLTSPSGDVATPSEPLVFSISDDDGASEDLLLQMDAPDEAIEVDDPGAMPAVSALAAGDMDDLRVPPAPTDDYWLL